MPMHPGIRLVQLGLRSLGQDTGPIDGWYGPRTRGAARGLLMTDDPIGTDWAFDVLQRGLEDLGWYDGPMTASWTDSVEQALAGFVAADGLPLAAAVVGGDLVKKPVHEPAPAGHSRKIRHGRTLVDTVYLHTAATPTTWWRGKSNQAMFDEIRRWHVNPKSKGGRGWSDIGYHLVAFPDGGVIYGRPFERVGAHVLGHNTGSLGFCMVPIRTITRMGQRADFYTHATIQAIKKEIAKVADLTQLRRLRGHNEDAAKLCPGFIVRDSEWTTLDVA